MNKTDLGRILESELRKHICDDWHYSDFGSYESFDELPEGLREACVKAAMAVVEAAGNSRRFRVGDRVEILEDPMFTNCGVRSFHQSGHPRYGRVISWNDDDGYDADGDVRVAFERCGYDYFTPDSLGFAE